MNAAYAEGMKAATRGEPISANPHSASVGSLADYYGWKHGYWTATENDGRGYDRGPRVYAPSNPGN